MLLSLDRDDRRGLALGSLWCLALFGFDVAEGPTPQVVGQTAVAPMLAGVLAGPRAVLAAGGVAVVVTTLHGWLFGYAISPSQLLRLLVIVVATAVGALTAVARGREQEQFAQVEAVAEAAQSAILRPRPASAAADIAVRYGSAQQEARVGGDAYEVQETPHGLRVLVADVRGKGLPAVRLAAAVLGAFREAAHRVPDLAEVARAMDLTVRREGESEDFVTAVIVEYADGEVRFVNCGHPDPLLLGRTGVRPLVPAQRTPPLGLVEAGPEPARVTLEELEVVLLYTDGVIECRDEAGRDFDLAATVSEHVGDDLELLLDGVLGSLVRHSGGVTSDDLALVAIRPTAASREATLSPT